MALQIDTRSPTVLASGIPSCPHCGDTFVAPDQSEFCGSAQTREYVRHYWSCDGCGREIQTRVELVRH